MIDFAPLRALLSQLGAAPAAGAASWQPMPGGASSRSYFRCALPEGSAVAMFVPDGPKPEEIDHSAQGARWPFLEVRDLLAARGVRVPRVLAEDTARGWLVLEDLGPNTLANHLLAHPEARAALYQRAVADLAAAQRALAVLPKDSVVARRSFDEPLLRWEIEHFREWALNARGIHLHAEDQHEFSALADRLAARVAAMPRSFVHRDYQSRNLMVQTAENGDFQLVWIDFQDALQGPRSYDLVALLGDSYQHFERSFVTEKKQQFGHELGLDANARDALCVEFEWVTLQRKLKDAGRFVFLDKVKQNPAFLPYVAPTVRKVMAALSALSAHEDARALAALLRRALPDDERHVAA